MQVEDATAEQRTVIENLIQLYVHDFTEYIKKPIGADGRFEYTQLSLYWNEPSRRPYIVRASGRLAGFALVKHCPGIYAEGLVWDMAEFFVVRGERGTGIGRSACIKIWKQLPGIWQIRVMPENGDALRFWSRTISHFLHRQLEPVLVGTGDQSRYVFLFESLAKAVQ